MVIVLFEHRLRPDVDKAEWEQTFGRMVGWHQRCPDLFRSMGTPRRMDLG
jgi:hypothetical protein